MNVGIDDVRVNGTGNLGTGVIFDNSDFSDRRWVVAANGSTTNRGAPKGFYVRDGTADATRLSIDTFGNVGIGVGDASKAKVEIVGFQNFGVSNYGFLNNTIPAGIDNTGVDTLSLSLHADLDIAARAYAAFSDERMKRIEGRSDAANDLATLRNIEVTDYTYIDTVSKGARPHKKVIAQQVETVFPQAVSRNTDVVPDIYQKAVVKDGWVELDTDLAEGERVRLLGESEDGVQEVLEVRDGAFRTAFQPKGSEVFVYGREVKDFRLVDYEAIAMLNVSATQELARQVAAKDVELAKLRAENTALAARLASLEAGDAAREARLTRLEKSLDNNGGAARTVSAARDLSASN